jgi:hypothetical protein
MENKVVKYKIVVPAKESGRLEGYPGNHYNWCGFCGSVGNIQQLMFGSSYTSFYSFCKGTKCESKYHSHASAYHTRCTDLTYGVPFLCIMQRNENGDLVVPINESKQESLTCAYCGKCNSEVIVNTCMEKSENKYEDTTFCKNNICCKHYKEYVNHNSECIKRCVPHAYRMEVN